MSSNKVSVIVRNMSESQVFLKKGVQVARVLALPVEPKKLFLVMEAVLGTEDKQQLLSVTEWQGKLLEKLDLEGLSSWTPCNAAST